MTATPHGLSTLGATDEKVEIVTMEDVNDIEKVTVGINSDPTVIKSTTRKIDIMIIPILTLMYLFSSLDKSNFANARVMGMMSDLGGDPNGEAYALASSLFSVGYAPLMLPLALYGKKTRLSTTIAAAGMVWGISSTCMAATTSFAGVYACRLFIGFGEAGFAPIIPFYMARFYTRNQLATRVGMWMVAAPLGGSVNALAAYGITFIRSRLQNWRILFLIEGSLTVLIAIIALVVLPERPETCRWLSDEERKDLIYRHSLEQAAENTKINWKHALPALYRWQVSILIVAYMCHTLAGGALQVFLPTFTSDAGFTGASAQIATLAPYGAAAIALLVTARLSDRMNNRGWFCQIGFWLLIVGFVIYLACPATNKAAKIVSLILAEMGYYVVTCVMLVWQANNCGSESRRAIAVPWTVCLSITMAIAAPYMFPTKDAPKYISGMGALLALSVVGSLTTGLYQLLVTRENNKRDAAEGKSEPGFFPDTATHADMAPGFRYWS